MSKVRCVWEGKNILAEAPIWCDRSKLLWWANISKAELHSLDPQSGESRIFQLPGESLGSFALRESGGFILALDNKIHAYDPNSGKLQLLMEVEPDSLGNRLNDSKCDRRGRLWIGSMDKHVQSPSGSFYRIAPDLSVSKQFDDVLVPNSVAFSPDDKRLYFSDTRRFKIWTFDFDSDAGVISNRRVFADTTGRPGRPDGSTADCKGFLWNAEFAGGRIVRYNPEGGIDKVIPVPVSQPTSVAFGGADLRTLFITTARIFLTDEQLQNQPMAGNILAVDLDVPGIPEPRFAG